ncbi:nicotinamide mononucleotide deamidase-related protein YfaY [Edwardsiella tarda]|uniref:nicotinamide mononucleotide deamidase-related protein YfaY n=1 Tax=Edwardsiella tarda TaxID=636 RepID=UPI00351C8883
MLRVEMLSSGDEVLHGQILDSNAAWLGRWLFDHGLPLSERATVGDEIGALCAAIDAASRRAQVLIVNGGLGPTRDDLTTQAAARVANLPLVEDEAWLAWMQDWFAQRGRPMAESNRKQALLPAGAERLDNPIGTACGFFLNLHDCMVFFTPGVPSEFYQMVEQQIMPRLQRRFALPAPPLCLHLTTFGRSESSLAEQLDGLSLPADCRLGYRSAAPIIELKLTGPAAQAAAMKASWAQVRALVAPNLLYEGEQSVARRASEALRQAGMRLALSEQFSAGMIHGWLRAADAPLADGELLAAGGHPTLSQVMGRARELAARSGAALTLASGELLAGQLTLALHTPQGSYGQTLRYAAAHHSQTLRREVCATLALDMVCRYLDGASPFGEYEWPTRLACEHAA